MPQFQPALRPKSKRGRDLKSRSSISAQLLEQKPSFPPPSSGSQHRQRRRFRSPSPSPEPLPALAPAKWVDPKRTLKAQALDDKPSSSVKRRKRLPLHLQLFLARVEGRTAKPPIPGAGQPWMGKVGERALERVRRAKTGWDLARRKERDAKKHRQIKGFNLQSLTSAEVGRAVRERDGLRMVLDQHAAAQAKARARRIVLPAKDRKATFKKMAGGADARKKLGGKKAAQSGKGARPGQQQPKEQGKPRGKKGAPSAKALRQTAQRERAQGRAAQKAALEKKAAAVAPVPGPKQGGEKEGQDQWASKGQERTPAYIGNTQAHKKGTVEKAQAVPSESKSARRRRTKAAEKKKDVVEEKLAAVEGDSQVLERMQRMAGRLQLARAQRL